MGVVEQELAMPILFSIVFNEVVMKYLLTIILLACLFVESVCAMKKEIEIKFTLDTSTKSSFEKWLVENAQDQGIEEHEEVYLNNQQRSFFFDHEQGFKDAHTTMRLRSKKVVTPVGEVKYKDLFCSKFCRVNEQNRIVSRDEFEIDLSKDDARSQLIEWLCEKGYEVLPESLAQGEKLDKATLQKFFATLGFTDLYELKKTRKIYRYKDLEIVFDDIEGIGSFIEIELKSDEQDVIKGTEQIHSFLREVKIEQIIQYDRSYLHMKVNPDYNFGRQLLIKQQVHSE